MKETHHFGLITGGLEARIGGVLVVIESEHRPPFVVDAVVEEEDTLLVLSTPAVLPDEQEHPLRVMTAVAESRPRQIGTIVVRGGNPLRLLAIIHDLSEDPSWRVESVAAALDALLIAIAERRVRSLCLPILGRVHGRLDEKDFTGLLRAALKRAPEVLERVWLVVPPNRRSELARLLA